MGTKVEEIYGIAMVGGKKEKEKESALSALPLHLKNAIGEADKQFLGNGPGNCFYSRFIRRCSAICSNLVPGRP